MWRYYFLLFIAVLAISCAAPLFKIAQPTDPLLAAAIRLSIACCLWTPWALHASYRQALSSRLIYTGLLAGICYSVHFGAWVASLGLCSVIVSTSLVTSTPVFLAIWGWWRGIDAPNRVTVIALVLSTIAIGLFSLQGNDEASSSHMIGIVLALSAAIAMAVYLLLTRHLGNQMVLAPFSWIATGSAAVILWAACVIRPHIVWPTAQGYYALIASAVIPQMIGHSALTYCVKVFTPTQVGMATLIEPMGAAIITWIVLGETLGMYDIVTAMIMLISLTMTLSQQKSVIDE